MGKMGQADVKKGVIVKMEYLFLVLLGIVTTCILGIGIMIVVPPPKSIPKLASISDPFNKVDFSKIPELQYYTARDGSQLAYREYPNKSAKQIVVLVHGSSGSSHSMHPLAEYLQKQGVTVYSLDIRGHGNSGRKGDIEYIGQLEDDLEDLVNEVLHNQKAILIGFSAGGGFVLRFAASDRQKLFSRYILLSPYLGYNSPTVKPKNEWAKMSYFRYIGILLLGPVGERLFGNLPVITFATDPQKKQYLVSQYSFRLLRNFGPGLDYKSEIAAIQQPLKVLVGDQDELFNAQAFSPLFNELSAGTKVIIVPEVGHITLTTSLSGISAIAKAIMGDE
jgi:pimeloyl-ACP methyl ester carboxylesterase